MGINKIRWFFDQIVIILEFLMKISKIWLISSKVNSLENYAGTDSIPKNEDRKLKFGLEVPMDFQKMLRSEIWIFDFFSNMSKILDKIGKMPQILDMMRRIPKKIKNWKNLFQVFQNPYRCTSRPNFSFLASFLWLEFIPV